MTVYQIKITRPDEKEMAYFWKLYYAAQRNDNRWGGWNVQDIAEELKCTYLDRKQKLFLLRAWQVLVDDQGGFGRFMSSFDTYVHNMQDPEQDVVAWKPEIIRMSEDADLLPVLLEAYQEAKQQIAVDYEIKARLCEESNSLFDRLHAKPHHNGMMQLSNELASVKEALRRLSAFARSHAGDIQYTGDHPIAVAEKLAGRELYGIAEQLDTAQAQFESLAGEPVSQPYKLPFEQWLSQQSEKVDVDCGCVSIEVLMCWMRKAYGAGNYPVIPDGLVMVQKDMTPEMMRAVQIGSELGAHAAANLSGAYGLFAEFWDVACRASMLQDGNSPVTQDRWIPVSERMPDKYDFDIWVFSPSKGIHDGIQWDGCEFADDEYQFKINDVSHWMKKTYPAAPQQEDV